MNSDLVDRIYECSVVPELWPAVLDDLAEMTESRGGLLFSARKALCWTASGSIRDVFEDYVNDGWFLRCPRRPCLMSQAQPSFFVEQDFWSEDQIEHDPIYRDFFRPRGLGWSAGTGLQVPTGDSIIFSVERTLERGPFEADEVATLNQLRPHLARSALVSARLGLQRAQGATDALSALRLPALLLSETGVVIEANSWAETLADQVRFGAGSRVSLSDKTAQEMLNAGLKSLHAAPGAGSSTFPLRDELGKATMVLHLIPIKRSAHDIFGQSFALLLMTPVSSERTPSLDLMRSLFDLTPAEARVAQGIAAGKTLEDLAQTGEVSINTVRNQLRRVLEKTGCTRQAELAALLASVAVGAAA
ncbi:helix-turn-helix transcriptional regulator [Phenylobacterium sp.]|uniref:helix-turn-helix transcriptional regulator n=1 Tax=Phenylobacterium sp. TaxID=1871053 RepID=UPI0027311B20|nr:helix-turn-helix transcriptional regulator [Phenylobacterium sp.]MDP1875357.1 helix-turn-helix transcriptional regulator [Phenylobacterium sp.]MDP3300104.1 helix-turn-helix transcriptional regulator [Phenylobacterium sp.]